MLNPLRWKILAILGIIQFMLVVDATVVNIALPHIQHDLGFSRAGLSWVVNGYVLMAGGFLLLGGRLADMFGRRRLFLMGVTIFGIASAICGAATSPAMLVTSRFFQGLGEALAAPAALGLIALLFTDHKERAKALGAWGGIAGIAGVTGTIISGLLTNFASWRWIFYINVPIAILGLIMVPRLVTKSEVAKGKRLDVTGALTATAGLITLVYGLLQAISHSWGSRSVLLPVVAGVVLLGAMTLIERRSKDPLIPSSFFENHTRLLANFAGLALAATFFAFIYLLTLFEQQVLGYSPLKGGLSYVPFGVALGVGVGMSAGMIPKLGIKPLIVIGFLGSTVGMLLTGLLHVHAGYAADILPALLVFGFFNGLLLPAAQTAALHKVTSDDSSLASAVQQAISQIGGALGLAVLVTIAARYTQHVANAGSMNADVTHGYTVAFRVSAVILVCAAVVLAALLRNSKTMAPIDASVPSK